MTSIKQFRREENIIIPSKNFIKTLLNISEDSLEECVVRQDNKTNTLIYEVKLKKMTECCPYCGGDIVGYGYVHKRINHPALRQFNGEILYRCRRYLCKICAKTCIDKNPFTFEDFNSSYLMLNSVMNYLGNLSYTLTMISEELNISPTMVNNYLDSYIVVPKITLPEWLGIDEYHSPSLAYKNSVYICMMIDGKTNTLNDVLGSRSKIHLGNYLSAFPREEREKVKYVTCDIWRPYIESAYRYLPNCTVAIDPYHYVKHLCEGFNQLRINIMKKQEYSSNSYYLLKKWHWLFEKDDINLDNPKKFNKRFNQMLNYRDLFNIMVEQFPTLYEAYLLKEEFRLMVKTATHDKAKAKYDDISKRFRDSGIREYNEFTDILYTWKKEILNSFLRPYGHHKITNAATENINGKINTYITVSHGISNFTRFRKRVLFALNPKVKYSISKNLKSDKYDSKPRGSYNKIKK